MLPILLRRFGVMLFVLGFVTAVTACGFMPSKRSDILKKKYESRISRLRERLITEKEQNRSLRDENVILRELAEVEERSLSKNVRSKITSKRSRRIKSYASEDLVYLKIAEAYRARNSKKLENARKVLNRRFPNSRFADRALYLQGDLAYQIGQYNRALSTFDMFLKAHPKSSKRAAVFLGKGRVYQKLKVMSTAKDYFQKVLKLYPGSREARQAKKYLKNFII